jgi:hypothetical protein
MRGTRGMGDDDACGILGGPEKLEYSLLQDF